MTEIVLLIIGILGVVFVVMLIVGLAVKRSLAAQREAVLERFDGQQVLLECPGANYFGRESKGLTQVRGNGMLLLTADQLHFEMLVGGNDITVPVARLKSVERVRSHLAKSKGVTLLKVRFTDPTGSEDSAAWAVRELDQWTETLERVIAGNPSSDHDRGAS